MKVRLKTFLAGVGVGILLALAALALLSGAPPGQHTVTTGVWEISAGTNRPVEYKRVVHHYP